MDKRQDVRLPEYLVNLLRGPSLADILADNARLAAELAAYKAVDGEWGEREATVRNGTTYYIIREDAWREDEAECDRLRAILAAIGGPEVLRQAAEEMGRRCVRDCPGYNGGLGTIDMCWNKKCPPNPDAARLERAAALWAGEGEE